MLDFNFAKFLKSRKSRKLSLAKISDYIGIRKSLSNGRLLFSNQMPASNFIEIPGIPLWLKSRKSRKLSLAKISDYIGIRKSLSNGRLLFSNQMPASNFIEIPGIRKT